MDYIHALLIAEDNKDEDAEVLDNFGNGPRYREENTCVQSGHQGECSSGSCDVFPPWCVYSNCVPVPQEIKKKLWTKKVHYIFVSVHKIMLRH